MCLPVSLVKIPLIALDAFWMYLSAKPPNPPRPSKEHVIPDWRERFLRSLAFPGLFLRTTYWTAGIIEASVLLSTIYPTHPVSRLVVASLVLNKPTSVTRLRITPTFVLGNILTCFGALLRLRCYNALGKLFSFELSIHNDHKLVEDGPYSVVRHPSYTGLILTIIGAYLNHVNGSWVSECGFLGRGFGAVAATLWIVFSLAVVLSLFLRIPTEEQMLRDRFGNEWSEWAKKVPYCLVPGIY